MTDSDVSSPKIRLKKPICIGIGGVSRSGKTFLARLLGKAIDGSIVIHQDLHIPGENEIPMINNHIDWERPEAIDWKSFREAVDSGILSGKTVIAEGLFAFHDQGINKLYDKAIFITLNQQEFLNRKRNDLRWGKEPEWYIKHIWKSYQQYGQLPADIRHPLIINGGVDFDTPGIIRFLQV